MNKYYALVLSLSNDIEEEVTISLNGLEVTCFAAICPYEIKVGKKYPVELEFMVFDKYEVEELDSESIGLERIDGFSYWVKGMLNNGVLNGGVIFKDDVLLSEFGHFDGTYIKVKVDRIDVEFLTS